MTAALIRWLGAAAVGLLCTLGALAVSSCGSRGPAIEEPAMDSPKLTQPPDSCITDHDCDVVDDCCRCDEGGKQFAIRVDAIADFMVERQERCAGVKCLPMTSNDPSCRGELVCGNFGRCRLIPPHQF